MKKKNKLNSVPIFFAVLSLILITITNINVYGQSIHKNNEKLIDASSPFEDITEYALAADLKGMKKSLKACETEAVKIKSLLKANDYKKLTKSLSEMKTNFTEKKYSNLALSAVDGYKILVQALNPKGLTVPKQVSLLDYTGFRGIALLGSKNVDWAALKSNAKEANKLWRQIEHKVKYNRLKDAVNTAINGMHEAAVEKNVLASHLSAEMDLALVDLLENYFSK
jgi:hypothetical protein